MGAKNSVAKELNVCQQEKSKINNNDGQLW